MECWSRHRIGDGLSKFQIGFVLRDLAHFIPCLFTADADYELMVCMGLALYGMAHAVLFADVFGRSVLPMGKTVIG